jgi:NAD(P)-dependent dehydrogenase (short-subunit alcohol dehydrogenase family)
VSGEFADRVAVVTGGASGIGAATARLLAREGARVAILDRDTDGTVALATEIGGLAVVADVRTGDEVDRAFRTVEAELGAVSVLVNSAGVGDLRPLDTVDEKLWHRLIDVNLTGTFLPIRAVVPSMRTAGRGAIVNVASLSGLMPTRNEAAYSAAKAGVIALTRSAALENGPEVRVNCVAPGYVATPLTAAFQDHPDAFAPIADQLPLRRMAAPEEIAEVIAFLASARSSYMTGQTLVVDGGASLPQAGTDAALAALFAKFSGA